MDFEGNQAASSSSLQPHAASSNGSHHQTERALRSSTRLKAAREKGKEREKDEATVEQSLVCFQDDAAPVMQLMNLIPRYA